MLKYFLVCLCVVMPITAAVSPTVHVIPHSHWDREWYMPFEQHRLRLVQLLDDVLREIEADSSFYFLADGQTIVIDDYLAIRPERRAAVRRAIRKGRLSFGPQYILPDTYLADAETQVRNHILAVRDAEQWQDRVDAENLLIPDFFLDVGYFPDTFGNTAQSPQLIKELGFSYAMAGRGFPLDDMGSEFFWQAPDGSKILTHAFADWYCNGMELTADAAALEKRFKNGRRFTATQQFVLMNGCDHQPLQTGISAVIQSLQSQRPEQKIMLSSPEKYFQYASSYQANCKTFSGEARNPKGRNGLGLEDVYSSRLYLKQANWQNSRLLESYAEPLAALASLYAGAEYPAGVLQHAWRLLLQNQVHDDICGCSVDEVHREMMTRFGQVHQIGSALIESSMQTLLHQVDMRSWPADSRALLVFNPSPSQRREELIAVVDFPDSTRIRNVAAYSPQGVQVPCRVLNVTRAFTYELPANRFRIPKYVTRVQVQLTAAVPSLGYAVYRLQRTEKECTIDYPVVCTATLLENQWLRVQVGRNGTYDLLDKRNGRRYENLGMYEFRSDGGDEYNFRAVSGESPLQVSPCAGAPEIIVNNGLQATWRFRQNVAWSPALQADKRKRAGRADMPLITELTLYQSQPRLDVCFRTENRFQDYRLRVQLPTPISSSTITSEGDFGWDTRPVKPIVGFRRDSYSLPQGVFSYVADQAASLIIANQGLTEIEPVAQSDGSVTACVTLLRCVGELGDWGYFPTPEAQCPGAQSAEFSLIPSGPAVDIAAAWPYARPFWSKDSGVQSGSWPLQRSFLPEWPPELILTAVKKAEKRNSLIVRGFNHTANKVVLPPLANESTVYFTNVLEQRKSKYSANACTVDSHKIFTVEATRRH